MKKASTKRDFKKFSQKNVHKRRSKDAAVKALAKALADVNGDYGANVKLKAALDLGRRGRESFKARSDEKCVRGVFSASKSGFGFVKCEESERDIFIPEGRCGGAIDGDLVEIVYHEYELRGETRTEGRVKKIVKYGRDSFIGTVISAPVSRRDRYRANRFQLLPDDSRVLIRPFIVELSGARLGDKVEAVIDRSAPSGYAPDCAVIRVFGDAESREANYEAILSQCGIELDFSDEELEAAEIAATEAVSEVGRVGFDEVIFTMDGADAKDLDDAVSIRRTDAGYELGVHIADVSHYVKEKTPLDRAVMARGNSVYFTDKVVPMLPRSLSNGACSLNAGEKKYAISAKISLSQEGEILGVTLSPSVIVSRVRGVYSEINELMSGAASEQIKEKYAPVYDSLLLMKELYLILKENSTKRGAVDFDADEAKIILGEDGEPIDIVRRERGLSERMIEQFMICANVAVASELSRLGVPCVYRVHAEPPADKLEGFLTFVHNLGFDTSLISRERVNAKSLSALLSAADERGLLSPVSYAMLRAMSKAEYSRVRSGHFGLGLTHYCHFTSPIRRLSDLALHRIIRRVIFEGKKPEAYAAYAGRAAAAATDAELRTLDAERRIENLYKVIYMSRFVGKEFTAAVSSVTSFGLFCMLENTCEGLVPISELGGSFFYDEGNASLRSRDSVIRLGDAVRVRLEEADIISGKLRFSLV